VLYIAAGGAVTRKSFGEATFAGSMSGVVDPTGRVHVIMDGDNKRVVYATACPAPGDVIE